MSTLRDSAQRAADVVRAAVEDGSLPSAAFGVAHADLGVVLVEAFGPARPDAPFCLASTTKPIATTLLGALVDQGCLAFDTPIADLVPELPRGRVVGRPATVLDVAAHTAGFGPHHRFFYDDERAPVPVLDAVSRLARPVLPVGRQWRYSNLGYGVLQVAIERAGGAPVGELVSRHVYAPLGMATAGWGGPHGPAGAMARHLTADERYPGYVTDHPCASEAWCGIDDLMRFGLAHARRSLLRPATHDRLASPAAPVQADGAAYAVGWVTRHHGGHRLLIHAGRMGGVGAHLVVVPSLGLVVAGLAGIETDRLAEAVGMVLADTVPGYAPPAAQPPWSVGAAHPSMRRRWSGVMQLGDDELEVVLDATGDRIRLAVAGVSAELVMPHVQPAMVAGHANLAVDHPLAPAGSMLHLDAVPVGDRGGPGESAPPTRIIGGLTMARYPTPQQPRQGDAVTGALHLVAGPGSLRRGSRLRTVDAVAVTAVGDGIEAEP
jgi:CubicO group peptidase (beta-lactamase class C family)